MKKIFLSVPLVTVVIAVETTHLEDAAKILTTLKLDNALGLDQGDSTALWFGGYKAGPGRNIPNAILFVHK